MTSATESPHLRYDQNHSLTPSSRLIGDMATSAITPMPPIIKRAHDTSLVSVAHDLPHRLSNSEQKFQASLLKNKALLVPTRLALKRQRAVLKGPTIRYQPIQNNTLQMELGNPDGLISHSDQDDDGHATTISPNINLLPEQNRTQSTSNHTSPLRGDTPHTVPTDISLLYREKPLFSHPITGNFIVQYAEENGSPSPCSYILPRKSCREKNAPAFTFGSRCLVEKKGGSRTGWQKQWFASSNPFTTKVDFNRESVWPTPFHYPARPSLGTQTTKVSFPAWSIGTRHPPSSAVTSETNPGPDTYDTVSAFRNITAKNTHITLKSRSGGTQISATNSNQMPGPGAHDERKFFSNKSSAPKHSFGKRIPTSLGQDPYVNTLPSIQT